MKRIRNILCAMFIVAALISGCTGTAAPQNITEETPTQTMQPTARPTEKPTITPSPEPTSTPAPVICNPGISIQSESQIALVPHIDITGITSELKDETLSVTIQLRDLPDEITVRREGIEKGVVEYNWSVDIDVDNNQETGNYLLISDTYSLETAEYKMMIAHFNPVEGEPITGPFKETIGGGVATVMKYKENGMSQFSGATYDVDTQANTITLSARIPGISEQSKLIFSALEYVPGAPPIYDRVCEIPVKPVNISYIEDFEDNIAQDWRFGNGWKILVEDGNHILHGAGSEQYPYAWYSEILTRAWADYAYQSRIRFIDDGVFICLRSNQKGFYNVMLSPSDNSTVFAENLNELGYNTFGGASYKFEKGKWYLVRFEAEGENLRLYIDDELIDQQKRTSHSGGCIGYYLGTGGQVDIDDIQVWSIPKQ